MIDGAAVGAFLRAYLEQVEAEQARLDGLDAVAGDGDHGATMVLGMRAVVTALPAPGASPHDVLREAAEAFSSVGGSIGPLWGTALLRAARAAEGHATLDAPVLAAMLAAAVDGLQERGKSEPGDKTLLDVMQPSAVAFAAEAASGTDAALAAGLRAARVGLEQSAALPARRGRARRLVERSVGATDPGAASACLAWETAARLADLSVAG